MVTFKISRPYDQTDNSGMSPLHYACMYDNLELVTWLDETSPKLSAQMDTRSRNPFDVGCVYGNARSSGYLYKTNPFTNTKKDHVNYNSFDIDKHIKQWDQELEEMHASLAEYKATTENI